MTQRRCLVAGGAGFVGSHLIDRLAAEGDTVIAIDNMITGQLSNLEPAFYTSDVELINGDVCRTPLPQGPFDVIYHLASVASPVAYRTYPIETLESGSIGTLRLLDLATRWRSKFIFTSTSEVYGDPLVHPQKEDYWGNVNPVGLRSQYDESKRFSEAAIAAYSRSRHVDATIVRVFNSFGPRMAVNDGRVVTEFILSALDGRAMRVFGSGLQTRSLCYVADTVDALYRASRVSALGPINVGGIDELPVLAIAQLVSDVMGVEIAIEYGPDMPDEPMQRRPDIALAKQVLDWEPSTTLREGLQVTSEWYARLRETVTDSFTGAA